MTVQSIDLDFCSEPVDLFCPVCGEQLFTRGTYCHSCPHLLFWGDSSSGQWSWTQDEYLPVFNRAVDRLYDEACSKGFHGSSAAYRASLKITKAAAVAAEVVARPSAFLMTVSTSDIGCGGMHNGSLFALFDYHPVQRKLIRDVPPLR